MVRIILIIVGIIGGLVGIFVVSAFFVGIYEAIIEGKDKKEMDVVSKLIQSSNLRSIAKISQISGLKESRTIKAIAGLIEAASEEADYFLNARIDYDKMEIALDNQEWKCSYCALVNPKENLVCSGCRASK